MILILIEETKNSRKIKYVFRQIFSYLGYQFKISSAKAAKTKEEPTLTIYYGKQIPPGNRNIIQIIPGKGYDRKEINLKNLYRFKNKKTVIFNYDIMLKSFSILSREEELGSKDLDKHKRFVASKSEIFTSLKDPMLNKYAAILDSIIKKFHRNETIILIKKCNWPDNKKFGVGLSHDVDIVKFIKSDILNINKIFDLLLLRNPYWQFNKIMKIEDSFGYKSTYFFNVKVRHKLDPNYSLKDKKIRAMINLLVENGNEIGLHSSYLAYNHKEYLSEEKKILEKFLGKKIGLRTHFMRVNVQDTLDLAKNLDFKYDSSLGYPANIGFRSGFCWPYKLYSEDKKENQPFYEFPLNVMDCSLFDESKSLEKCQESLKEIFSNVSRSRGLVIIDWHQRTFNERFFKNFSSIYIKILEYFRSNNAYVGTIDAINNWIIGQNSLRISTLKKGKYMTISLSSDKKLEQFAIKVYGKFHMKSPVKTGQKIIKEKEGFIIIFDLIDENKPVNIDIEIK